MKVFTFLISIIFVTANIAQNDNYNIVSTMLDLSNIKDTELLYNYSDTSDITIIDLSVIGEETIMIKKTYNFSIPNNLLILNEFKRLLINDTLIFSHANHSLTSSKIQLVKIRMPNIILVGYSISNKSLKLAVMSILNELFQGSSKKEILSELNSFFDN